LLQLALHDRGKRDLAAQTTARFLSHFYLNPHFNRKPMKLASAQSGKPGRLSIHGIQTRSTMWRITCENPTWTCRLHVGVISFAGDRRRVSGLRRVARKPKIIPGQKSASGKSASFLSNHGPFESRASRKWTAEPQVSTEKRPYFVSQMSYQTNLTANWICLDGVCVEVIKPALDIRSATRCKVLLE
jgi:hypothetical protein